MVVSVCIFIAERFGLCTCSLSIADPGKYLTNLAYIGLDGVECGVSPSSKMLSVFGAVNIYCLEHRLASCDWR